jgi:hypothetical protein
VLRVAVRVELWGTDTGTATSPPRPVRWGDNRLSNLSFDMPAGYFNLDAHCNASAAVGG